MAPSWFSTRRSLKSRATPYPVALQDETSGKTEAGEPRSINIGERGKEAVVGRGFVRTTVQKAELRPITADARS